MRKLSAAEWEKKYIVGQIEQFDQKYTMFNRPIWDPEVTAQLDDWSLIGEPGERPGYGTWSGQAGASLNCPRSTSTSRIRGSRRWPCWGRWGMGSRRLGRTGPRRKSATQPPQRATSRRRPVTLAPISSASASWTSAGSIRTATSITPIWAAPKKANPRDSTSTKCSSTPSSWASRWTTR